MTDVNGETGIKLEELRWEDPGWDGPAPRVDDSLQTGKPHTPAQARTLRRSMERRGFIESSVVVCAHDGRIVDGIHRVLEARRHDLSFDTQYLADGYSDDELREIGRLLNHARRHETADEWQANEEAIAKSIEQEPELSNVKRAKKLGVTETTVRNVKKRIRKGLATTGTSNPSRPLTSGSEDEDRDGVANPASSKVIKKRRRVKRHKEAEVDPTSTPLNPDPQAEATSFPKRRPQLPPELDEARLAVKVAIEDLPIMNSHKVPAEQGLRDLVAALKESLLEASA